MGLDAILKRFHVLVVGALVAIAAWLQAAGIGQLVATSLGPGAPPAVTTRASGGISSRTARNAARTAAPILARNPFDSVTGPLDGSNARVADAPLPTPKDSDDPYQDPPCSGVKASLISAADDPEWSFASLTSGGTQQLRRRGDEVGGAKVMHIGWFPQAATAEPVPRVWLQDGGSRCIVEMGAGDKSKKVATKTPPASTGSKNKQQSAIMEKIRQVGDNSFVVERSAVDQIIQNYAKLAGSLRTRPTKEGMRLSGIKQDTILGKLGMKNGDVLKSINGFDMNDPEKALEAYSRLRTAQKLSVTLDRGGSPQTIDLAIE